MTKYKCYIDPHKDTIQAELVRLVRTDNGPTQALKLIATRCTNTDFAIDVIVVLKSEDALDLATRIMEWVVHEQRE